MPTGLLLTYPVHPHYDILFLYKGNVVPKLVAISWPHIEITLRLLRLMSATSRRFRPSPSTPLIPGLDGRR